MRRTKASRSASWRGPFLKNMLLNSAVFLAIIGVAVCVDLLVQTLPALQVSPAVVRTFAVIEYFILLADLSWFAMRVIRPRGRA